VALLPLVACKEGDNNNSGADGSSAFDGGGGSTCPGAQIMCGGACIDPQSNYAYCGAKGDCAGANKGTNCPFNATCSAGVCKNMDWSTEFTLQKDALKCDKYRVVLDGSGNAMVVWHKSGQLHASRYSAAAGSWSSPQRIDDTARTGALSLLSAGDFVGNVLAVWHYRGKSGTGETTYHIGFNRFDGSSGSWNTAKEVTALGTGRLTPLVIAMSPSGDAILV